MAELDKAIQAKMPKEVEEQARKELRRLQRMPEASRRIRHGAHLSGLADRTALGLPEEKPIDIEEARRILDEDHYDLDKIKQRIIEYLAVRKLAPQGKAPILCFVGPPGVGKTSLGQSIARAMGRKFVRMSLGGMHDEAEIRGHRRTYIGALPGNIIQAIRRAGVRNPVLMLDEIDKLGADIQGDPGAACWKFSTPSRTTRSAIIISSCRSICPACSSSPRPTRWTRFPGRCSTAWRSSAFRLHRRRETGDRQALSGAPAVEANGLKTGRSKLTTRRSATSSSITRAKRACAVWSGRSARRCAKAAVRIAEGQ